ncbi:helix-turn-helix transcriptional regulator [Bacillus marinisedimentorum]|uniref:helix-turn-helix transcriptional regulator n=1 Tax=Bacillus marinisedimentorum TaxID=1821260 RepID=UPI001FE0DC35|nr:WYL domain-containing protein [Bacillus marinisedimentorum]
MELREILLNETDELHELSVEDLIGKLKLVFGEEFEVDKRAIKRDINALNDTGFEVMENTGEKGKKLYSHQDPIFETYQLRLLVDAVLSAKFITEDETDRIISKLKLLTSRHIAKSLPSPLIYSQPSSVDYKQIKFNIDKIHTAISDSKHLRYQYGTYNARKEFTLHRDGGWYDVQPYALIWNNDFYYLIGKFMKTGEMRHYRVDRMRDVKVKEEQRFKKELFDITAYVGKSFQMFSGEEDWIKIRFSNILINPVLDRFGMGADIRPADEDHFILSAKASVSDGLIGWILNWGSKAKVISPPSLVQKMTEETKKLHCLYSGEE